jgi:hypothetical protein
MDINKVLFTIGYVLLCLAFYSHIKSIRASNKSNFYNALALAAQNYPDSADVIIAIERYYMGKSCIDEKLCEAIRKKDE